MAGISAKTVGEFESIQEYRQRTGKTKEELSCDDYVEIAFNALTAAGFDIGNVAAQVSLSSVIPERRMYEIVVRLAPKREAPLPQGHDEPA
jgi:hypothetical protein